MVDLMGGVHELMAVQNCKTCKELATSYITIIDSNLVDIIKCELYLIITPRNLE